LSSADALLALRKARDEGANVSAETCPHYLHFTAETIPDGATAFKCAPPIREAENRERLWSALEEGLVGQVVTDHSPSSPDLKCVGSGDFMRAWGGIASLQLGLPAVWTEARARGRSLDEVVGWMSSATARLVGLERRKGAIAVGNDADLVIFDPDAELRVAPERMLHRHKLTPYAGEALRGVVVSTYLRGRRVFHQGRLEGGPTGRWIAAP
jgi:allantoinase